MKRKLAFLGAILLAAFIFTCEGNTYRTYALDEEDRAWIDEASKALQEIVEEREVMALVATVPSGQLVMIRDATVDESCQVWEKVSADVNGKVYEGYIPRDNLACSDERFLEWEELYGMNSRSRSHADSGGSTGGDSGNSGGSTGGGSDVDVEWTPDLM